MEDIKIGKYRHFKGNEYRVLFVDEGRIIEEGTPEQIFQNPQNPRTQDFLRKVL